MHSGPINRRQGEGLQPDPPYSINSCTRDFLETEVSFSDGSSNQIGFEGDPRFSNSEASTICSSNSDEIDTVEDIIPYFSYAPDSSIVFDYVSIGSNSDDGPNDNTYQHTEGSKHGGQNFSSSDAQLLKSGKKGKQIKASPRSASAHKYGGFGNLHVRAGKENNLSVWQKVQRNDVDTETKISPVCFQSDMSLKETPSLKRNSIAAEVNTLSRTVGKKLPKDKVSKKLKRKNSLGSKLDNSYHGRGHSSNKASFNTLAKTGMGQNETFGLTAQVDDQKGGKSISKTHSVNSCLMVPSPVYLPHLFFNKGRQMEKGIALAEYSKQNHSSGSVMQKWIPIGVRDSELATSARFGNSLPDPSDRPASEDFTLRNAQENASFNSQDLDSSLMLGTCQDSGNASSPQEDDHSQKLKNSTGWMLELNKKHIETVISTSESSDQRFSSFEDKSLKIIQAVKDACRVQMECEAIQMSTGSPVAEFERFLHFSSPVISQLPSLSCCQTCLCDRLVGAQLCRHEIPCIPLGCLWKWYEEHGNYGLEVRAEDFKNSKSWGLDCISFRGYFVPFLSAVQLFKKHTIQPINKAPDHEIFGSKHEACESLEDSKDGHLPIFSELIPKPCTTAAAQSVDVACSDDAELLFEYFEPEQPQQRQPLYEKIQELVRGNASSGCKMYGDPTNLASLNLRDLHPRSWYSVAWYPIYRIPEGNFRTAFSDLPFTWPLWFIEVPNLIPRVRISVYVEMFGGLQYFLQMLLPSPPISISLADEDLDSFRMAADEMESPCMSIPLICGECWFQPRHSVKPDRRNSKLKPFCNHEGTVENARRDGISYGQSCSNQGKSDICKQAS
ncbi:DUF789 FAMILY PROTEIN [Salix koriyanagi]|uniref:DUF789 FAMILY PROTEIN n=1 Tax=Salix koriyanagi TaxID=2511006 RepID=A0A9Q0ZL31_9ROSI|nr:DUF789 FAMILY PROTEIN [Salix koriyanagi]